MGGVSKRNFKMFRKLCGDETLSNVAIMTNMWGQVDPQLGEAREKELASRDIFFKPVLDKGAKLVRHDSTLKSAQGIVEMLLKNEPMALGIQKELGEEKKDISETAAFFELDRELKEEQARHRAEIAQLQQEMMEAIRDHDEETRRELEAERNKLNAEVERIERETRNMTDDYAKERERFKRQMEEEAARVREENAKLAEEYQKHMVELQKEIQNRQSSYDADTQRLRQQLAEYQRALAEQDDGGGFWGAVGSALKGFALTSVLRI